MVPGLRWKQLSAGVRNIATLPFLVLLHEHSAHAYRAGIRLYDESEGWIRATWGSRVAKSFLQPFKCVLDSRCPFLGSLRGEVRQGWGQFREYLGMYFINQLQTTRNEARDFRFSGGSAF